MGEHNYHTPITGTPDIRTALNTALGELDSAIDTIGRFNAAVVGHEAASGTDGGTASSTTWNTRTIAGLEQDSDSIVSVSSNQFTPVSGTYLLYAHGAGYGVDQNRLRLYNATQAAAVAYGASFHNQLEAVETTLTAIFTANGTDAYEIQHYTNTGVATNGFGNDDGSGGTTERYLQVLLLRFG